MERWMGVTLHVFCKPGEEGIEPSTNDFGDHCSTAELFPLLYLERLELSTFGSVVRCSSQLSYRYNDLVGFTGIEPVATGLRVPRSTN